MESTKIDYWGVSGKPAKRKKESGSSKMIEYRSLILNKEETKDLKQDTEADQLLLKNRQYLSMADVMEMMQYKHLRVANFCEHVRVCSACYRAYQTIDKLRQKGLQKNGRNTRREGPALLTQRTSSQFTTKSSRRAASSCRKTSQCASPSRNSLERVINEPSKFIKYHLNPGTSKELDSEACSSANSLLPRYYINQNTKKKYVEGPEVELLGLKFALGHTSHLTQQNAIKRCFLTKSSFALNKLNDLHLLGDIIERKMEIINCETPGYTSESLKAQWLENRQKSETKKSSFLPYESLSSSRAKSTQRVFTERNSIIDLEGETVHFSKRLKNIKLPVLANEDDVRVVDQEKGKWVEEEHSPRRSYYKARDMDTLFDNTELCSLAKSVLAKKYEHHQ